MCPPTNAGTACYPSLRHKEHPLSLMQPPGNHLCVLGSLHIPTISSKKEEDTQALLTTLLHAAFRKHVNHIVSMSFWLRHAIVSRQGLWMCNEANSHQHDDTIGFQWDAMQTVFSCNFAHVLSHTNWCHANFAPHKVRSTVTWSGVHINLLGCQNCLLVCDKLI